MHSELLVARHSLADAVYDHLRQRIVTGALHSGERLMEPALAESLGVSRTPVREALRRLEQEGLVRRNPRDQGRYIQGLAFEEIGEVLGVRAVLEGYAARLAAERVTNEELDVLASTHALAKTALEDTDLERLVELNTQFHDGIIAASRAPHCAALIEQLRDRILQYRSAFLRRERRRLESFGEHEAILAALKERDADRAETLLRGHVAQIAVALSDERRHPQQLDND